MTPPDCAPTTGTTGLFLINTLSFFAVIAAVLGMRRSELHVLARAGKSTDLGVRGSVRYVLRTPWLLVLLALAFVLGSLGRNYQVTMAAMSAGPLEIFKGFDTGCAGVRTVRHSPFGVIGGHRI
ncbi:hypothetical protein [Sphaerisporangium perillae]|uniref:hypothetical protein n=1 Tax=Sphaerisporangium perillae TaxID=2935860 RepID=UPI00200FE4BB|nr:hypothetical protein [Sphaerisporangium perillae]